MIEKEIDQKIDTYKKQLISKYMTFINKNFLRMKLYFNQNLIVYAICIFRLFFLLPLLKHLCIYAFLNEFLFQSLNQFLCYYYSYAHVQISKITLMKMILATNCFELSKKKKKKNTTSMIESLNISLGHG